jgi:hypothetical protein
VRKGIDAALFRKVKVDNTTGKVVEDSLVMQRPSHAVKELPRRIKARKVAKQARKRNR